jgi:uncharacterized membrane protein
MDPLRLRPPGGRADAALAAIALAVIVVALLLPPHGLLDKADRAAFAVCHRIEARTFAIAGRPLPLCARCSGAYLGATTALLVLALRGRGRAARMPARPYLILFGVFLALWAVDGFNSFLTLIPGAPHLYEPSNALRLVTGTLQGVALAAILLPMINAGFRRDVAPLPSIAGAPDLIWLLAGGGLVIWLVSRDWPLLLYPLAIASGLAVVAAVALFNGLALRTFGSRQSRTSLVAVSVALALVEIAAVGVMRSALEAAVGAPL